MLKCDCSFVVANPGVPFVLFLLVQAFEAAMQRISYVVFGDGQGHG